MHTNYTALGHNLYTT